MQRLAGMLALGAVAALCSQTASASVVWRGTFESGDLSKWSTVEAVNPDRLQVVADPTNAARKVLKVKVVQGDNPIHASGNRNELAYTGDPVKEGEERFYQWSTMWPESFKSADTWQLFTQWHHTGTSGSPPVEFYTLGDQMYLRCSGNIVWSAPLDRGHWHEFMLHIVWSSKESTGSVELYEDGQLTLPKTHAKTLFPGQGVYLKQGLYRNANITQEQTIYHSGVTIATAKADLEEKGKDYSSNQGASWERANEAQATGGGGCASSGMGLAWPAFGVGLAFLSVRHRRLKYAKAVQRR